MNEVFAIDPKAFTNVLELKYLFEQFGYSEGRFVGQLPKKWIRMVDDHIASWPDVSRNAALTLLQRYCQDRMVHLGYSYESEKPWLANAMDAKAEKYVADVIAARGNGEGALTIDSIDDGFFRRWGGPQFEVLSSADEYAKAASVLLYNSHEVVFVDPYLGSFKSGFKRVLEQMVSRASAGKKCEKFRIFTIVKDSTPDQIRRGATHFFRSVRDKGISVEFTALEDVGDPRADDHSRFMFSIKGAMQFDRGFDEETPPRNRKVSFVGGQIHDLLCSQYLEGDIPFKIILRIDMPCSRKPKVPE